MTWQRIDDDIYIDDTLVTCAEYQLFIDEMREQGHYYQPDHWTSYQFPEGQARKPILGVRHSDAMAFCDWLMLQESTNRKYRLPTQDEGNKFSIKSSRQNPLGYWGNKQSQFTWVDPVLNNPRKIEFISIKYILEKDIEVASEEFEGLPSTKDINTSIENACNRAQDGLDIQLSIVRAEAQIFDFDSVINRMLASKRIFEPARTLSLKLGLARMRDWTEFSKRTLAAFDLYIDTLSIQERIAGRSPAFEGIRLVKYREQS
jgi:hypothetical protein